MKIIGLFVVLSFALTVWAAEKGKTNVYQQQELLFWHNKARRNYAKSGWCANMLEMEWDPKVAGAAVANVCATSHNGKAKSIMGRYVGENLAYGQGTCNNGGLCAEAGICGKGSAPACDSCNSYCSIKSMVYSRWYLSETADQTANTKCVDLHCTQNVWQKSYGVGCAFSVSCPGQFNAVLNCNYDPPGNFNSDSCRSGKACSQCPSTHPHCNDGLCSRSAGGSGGGGGGGSSPAPAPQPSSSKGCSDDASWSSGGYTCKDWAGYKCDAAAAKACPVTCKTACPTTSTKPAPAPAPKPAPAPAPKPSTTTTQKTDKKKSRVSYKGRGF
jgi:hypothetical protein